METGLQRKGGCYGTLLASLSAHPPLSCSCYPCWCRYDAVTAVPHYWTSIRGEGVPIFVSYRSTSPAQSLPHSFISYEGGEIFSPRTLFLMVRRAPSPSLSFSFLDRLGTCGGMVGDGEASSAAPKRPFASPENRLKPKAGRPWGLSSGWRLLHALSLHSGLGSSARISREVPVSSL